MKITIAGSGAMGCRFGVPLFEAGHDVLLLDGWVTVDTAAALATMKAQFDPTASGSHLASMLQDLMNSRRTEIAHLNRSVAARRPARRRRAR